MTIYDILKVLIFSVRRNIPCQLTAQECKVLLDILRDVV